MNTDSRRSNLIVFYGIFVIFLVLTVTHCAPQNLKSPILGDVFQENGGVKCEDLKNHGYEGFECVTKQSCGDDGFIERSVLEGDLAVWRDEINDYEVAMFINNTRASIKKNYVRCDETPLGKSRGCKSLGSTISLNL